MHSAFAIIFSTFSELLATGNETDFGLSVKKYASTCVNSFCVINTAIQCWFTKQKTITQ